MPRVQTYGPQKATRAPLPGVRREARETFESQGGTIAQAEGQRADVDAQVASTVRRLGVQAFGAIQQHEREKADQVALLAADRQLGELELELLHANERGALTVRGKDTLPLREKVLTEYDTRAGEIEGGLSSDRQKMAFQRARAARRLAITESVERHTAQQMTEYDKAETAASIDQDVALAVTNAGDPRRVATSLADGIEKIRQHAKRNGLGPEATDALITTFRNETWVGVITNRLATGNDRTARVFLEEARDAGHLTGEALTRMQEAVKHGTTDAEGERRAAAIWDRLGPQGDGTPIELDKLEAAARTEAGDDTGVLKATIAALRTRKQGVDDARRERADGRASEIWGAVFEGKSLAEIRRLPAFVDAPGEVRTKVADYFEAEAARTESRAAARESRVAAAEQRVLNADVRRERKLELEGWSKYWELAQPDTLRRLSHGAIVEQLPTLGSAHVQRLLTDQAKLTKDDATYREAVIDKDLFREVANEAGLSYVYHSPQQLSASQRANLGKLQAVVEDEIGRRQVAAGRKLTRDETRKVMTDVVDAKVTIDKPFWFDGDAQIAAVVDEQDRARAYVPLAQVPAAATNDYANWLRSEMPALARLSTDDIKVRYRQRLERAYALRLLGAKRAEIESVLRGQ